jgi:hypothetical protein
LHRAYALLNLFIPLKRIASGLRPAEFIYTFPHRYLIFLRHCALAVKGGALRRPRSGCFAPLTAGAGAYFSFTGGGKYFFLFF